MTSWELECDTVELNATEIEAPTASIIATQSLQLLESHNMEKSEFFSKSRRGLGGRMRSQTGTIKATSVGVKINSEMINFQSPQIGMINPTFLGEANMWGHKVVIFPGSETYITYGNRTRGNGWWVTSKSGSDTYQTWKPCVFEFPVNIMAPQVEYGLVKGHSLPHTIQVTGNLVIKELLNKHIHQHKSMTGPGPATLVLVAIAVGYLTGGTGDKAVAKLGMSGKYATVTAAAIDTIIVKFAVDMAATRGDLKHSLGNIASSETLKEIVVNLLIPPLMKHCGMPGGRYYIDDVSLRILLYSSLDVLIEGDGWKEALKSRSQEQILRGIVEALNIRIDGSKMSKHGKKIFKHLLNQVTKDPIAQRKINARAGWKLLGFATIYFGLDAMGCDFKALSQAIKKWTDKIPKFDQWYEKIGVEIGKTLFLSLIDTSWRKMTWKESLSSRWQKDLVEDVMPILAERIGDIDSTLGKYASHFVLGAAAGCALGDDELSGAVGGAIGAVLGEYLMDKLKPSLDDIKRKHPDWKESQIEKEFLSQIKKQQEKAKLITASGVFLTGADVDIGVKMATNAMENNLIPHLILGVVWGISAISMAYQLKEDYDEHKDDPEKMAWEMTKTVAVEAAVTATLAKVPSLIGKSITYGNKIRVVIAGKTKKVVDFIHTKTGWKIGKSAEKEIAVIQVKMKKGWNAVQRKHAEIKVKALQNFNLRKTAVEGIRLSKHQVQYRNNILKRAAKHFGKGSERYRKLAERMKKMDADHLHEIQLGGASEGMKRMIDSSVNRSLGAQIKHQMKNLEEGAKVIIELV